MHGKACVALRAEPTGNPATVASSADNVAKRSPDALRTAPSAMQRGCEAGRRGTVCIFPGRTEWIEKYFETVRDLRSRGFAAAILDWRGQGLSDRALADRFKGHVRSFAEFDIDLETFMRDVVLPDCPPPIFALALSLILF